MVASKFPVLARKSTCRWCWFNFRKQHPEKEYTMSQKMVHDDKNRNIKGKDEYPPM